MKSTSDFIKDFCENSSANSQDELRFKTQKDIYNKFGKAQCLKYLSDKIWPFDKDEPNWKLLQDKSRHYSNKILWYEITTTHPDKSKTRKDKTIESLKTYCEAESFEGHFEIGKKGLYHYHFKVGTHKYLRKEQIENINDKYRVSCSLIRDMKSYNNYIVKKPENVKGWEDVKEI